ncbi:DNA-binding protein [Pseudomonas sp. PDM26]|uniref:DNA-binding protein n=1 Tax=Pseudomonas sp. PDM26 TaxID=2854766 RepID=UPI001C493DFD|nr:DNA-binding protein [Pseudomonas sp. PDM26]MBV7547571.1 DNA-binding protein [Pseudomonas sp. PDM26]
MRESPITTQDIVDAGNSILASGRAVNGYSLRNAIGSGRADRLIRIWTEHAELNGTAVAGSMSIPARAQTLISTYVKRQEASVNLLLQELAVVLSEAARSDALEEIESLKASVEQQRNALLDADLLIDRLEQTNQDLETQLVLEQDNSAQVRSALESLEDQARKDSSALSELNSQLLEAQEQVSSLRGLLEDEKTALGRTENEVLRLEERVAGLVETSKQQDTALLDARRDAQASREREAMVNGQMLQLQRDRDVDVELITRLRLEVGTAATRVSQSEAEANAYKGQLAQLNDRVGGLLSSVGPGGSHE